MLEEEILDFSRRLECLPQFCVLTAPERDLLMQNSTKSLVDKGQILFQQGDFCSGLHISAVR